MGGAADVGFGAIEGAVFLFRQDQLIASIAFTIKADARGTVIDLGDNFGVS
jgi:hypothetical protein